jgi:hypothetical protein
MTLTAPSTDNKLDALRNAVQARLVYEAALDELALVSVGNASARQRETMDGMALSLAAGFPREDFEPELVNTEHLVQLEEQLGR